MLIRLVSVHTKTIKIKAREPNALYFPYIMRVICNYLCVLKSNSVILNEAQRSDFYGRPIFYYHEGTKMAVFNFVRDYSE